METKTNQDRLELAIPTVVLGVVLSEEEWREGIHGFLFSASRRWVKIKHEIGGALEDHVFLIATSVALTEKGQKYVDAISRKYAGSGVPNRNTLEQLAERYFSAEIGDLVEEGIYELQIPHHAWDDVFAEKLPSNLGVLIEAGDAQSISFYLLGINMS